MTEQINVYKIGKSPEELQAALMDLRSEYDAHIHDGINSKTFQTIIADTISTRTMLIRKLSYADNTAGFWMGLLNNIMSLNLGNVSNYLKWNGISLDIAGNLSAGSINIPNATNPLFSVDTNGNVIANSLRRKDFHWFTMFESIDGYQQVNVGTGAIAVSRSGITLSTGATASSTAEIIKGPTGTSPGFSWSKRRSLKTIVTALETSGNPISYIVSGDVVGNNTRFGFNIIGTQINSSTGNGTNSREVDLNTALVAGTPVVLEAVFNPGVDVKYYVDGVLKLTETTYIPSGNDFPFELLDISITNGGAAANKRLLVNMFDFWQEN